MKNEQQEGRIVMFKMGDFFKEEVIETTKIETLVGKEVIIEKVGEISDATRPTVTITFDGGITKTSSPYIIEKMKVVKEKNYLPIAGKIIKRGKSYDII